MRRPLLGLAVAFGLGCLLTDGEAGPAEALVLLALAGSLVEHDHADHLYMELLTADPGNDLARRRIAEIRKVEPHQVGVAERVKPHQLPEAVEVESGELAVQAAAGSGFDPEERLGEARVFAKYGLLDKASAHLEEILRHFPNHVESRQALVDLMVDRGDGQAAIAVARPLYEAYRKAGDEAALASLMALEPALARQTPAPAPRRAPEDHAEYRRQHPGLGWLWHFQSRRRDPQCCRQFDHPGRLQHR